MIKVIALILISCLSAFSQQKYALSLKESFIYWKGKMAVGNDTHGGTIRFTSGNIVMGKDGKISSADFEIDMNTIRSSGIKSEKDGIGEHLRSEDFFAVKRFPKAYFVGTKMERTTPPNNYSVQGLLTIKGVKNPIVFTAKIVQDKETMKATAELTLFRSRWGVNYKAFSFLSAIKNDLIAEEVPIKLDMVFRK